jgi:hypothetical protein
MDSKKQVLILGAGASFPYGFPTGNELFNSIKETYPKAALEYVKNVLDYGSPPKHPLVLRALNFIENLKGISAISIDKYLNFNHKHINEGTKAIVIDILQKEVAAIKKGMGTLQGDWYEYLFSKMIAGFDTFDAVKNGFHSNISIITFNYDRSLEHYLFTNMYNIFKSNGVSEFEIASVIESIPIVHVYGKVGYLPWETKKENDQTIKFGNPDDDQYAVAETIMNMIKLIYAERKDEEPINKAKDLISNADRILFLGFGYDEQNLQILGFPQIRRKKEVFGTALGYTENECIHIENLLRIRNPSIPDQIKKIKNCDSLTLLREHLLVKNILNRNFVI